MRLLLLSLLALAACDPAPELVGRRCDLGTAPAASVTVVSSPSLDCESRICLQAAGAERALCTTSCEQDSDCVGDPTTPCGGGFVCVVPTDVGPFAHQWMCACRDDLAPP